MKLKIEYLLILVNLLFSNHIFSKELTRSCDELLSDNNYEEALKTKTPSQLRQALITADKCLDNALRDIVNAETMGERLKVAKSKFTHRTYDSIWRAHKIRNSLVHETEFEPTYSTLISAIEDLQDGESLKTTRGETILRKKLYRCAEGIQENLPYKIPQNHYGDNTPTQDTYLSPLHCLYKNGMRRPKLVPRSRMKPIG